MHPCQYRYVQLKLIYCYIENVYVTFCCTQTLTVLEDVPMEESVSMERVTVLIRTLDMPAITNYVRLHLHVLCTVYTGNSMCIRVRV